MNYHTDVTKLSLHLLFYQLCSENNPFFINKVKKQSVVFCALRKQAACELSTFHMQTVHMDVDRCGVTLKRFGPDTSGKVHEFPGVDILRI